MLADHPVQEGGVPDFPNHGLARGRRSDEVAPGPSSAGLEEREGLLWVTTVYHLQNL